MRGKQLPTWATGERYRSIPAWAGETALTPPAVPSIEVYPRVGGGNNPDGEMLLGVEGLSPRGRGKPLRRGATPERLWSIPAWAGETSARPPGC